MEYSTGQFNESRSSLTLQNEMLAYKTGAPPTRARPRRRSGRARALGYPNPYPHPHPHPHPSPNLPEEREGEQDCTTPACMRCKSRTEDTQER
jgi:hypothetical protein